MRQGFVHRPPTESRSVAMPLDAGKRRFLELDGLRGIAALWVVVFHLTFGLKGLWLRDQPDLYLSIVPFVVNIEGLMAVDLFFVVSGFVIVMTIERCRTLADFLASRFARLFPAYWAAVAISTAVGVSWPSPHLSITPGQALLNLTMLQGFLGVRNIDPSYWSLSIELGFYGMMAVMLRAGQCHRVEVIGMAWVLVSFAAMRLLPLSGLMVPWRLSTGLALSYAGLFYTGIIFYRIRTNGFTWLRAGAIALSLALRLPGMSAKLVLIECVIYLVFALAVAGRLPVLRARLFLMLGGISYSLYLVHQPLGFRLQLGLHALGAPPWLNLAGTLVVLVLVATALTYAIERPCTRAVRSWYAGLSSKPPCQNDMLLQLAERVGFEPTVAITPHTLSKRAP